jgi:cysteine desulfurase
VFHTDAAQAAGKITIDVQSQNIDLLSISAHKLYGPKGVGVFYVRNNGPQLAPLIDGGGHEHGLRSGTLNVPGIVGLGRACEICREEMATESARLSALRDRLREMITSELDGVSVNGSVEHRLPGNLNMSFANVNGEELLTALDEIALSSGAACTSAHIEPSYVLTAMGLPNELAQASLRFGIGRFSNEDEITYVGRRVIETVRQLRELN